MPRAKSTKTPQEIAKNKANQETKRALKAVEDVQSKLKYELRDCENVDMYKQRNQTMKNVRITLLKYLIFGLLLLKTVPKWVQFLK